MSAPEHGSLPLPDYDLPLPALGHRIRSLRADEIAQLLDYEEAHANHPLVVQIFRTRLDELAAGEQPSGGRPAEGPEWPAPAASQPKVRPETAGPPVSPPPHGTPSQPARPKADQQHW